MLEARQATGPQVTPPPRPTLDAHSPRCCSEDMQILLRRAVLHSDGSVDFQTAWGCSHCGRRIL